MNGIQQKELEKKLKNKHYDIVFIGAGVISILEAVYQSKLGNSVLIVEKDDDIGEHGGQLISLDTKTLKMRFTIFFMMILLQISWKRI